MVKMPIIDFTRMDPRDLFAVIHSSESKSFSLSHRALEKLDFKESIKRKKMSQSESTLKAKVKNMAFSLQGGNNCCRRHCGCFQRHNDGLAVSKGAAGLESELGNENLKGNNGKRSPHTIIFGVQY